MHTRSSSTILTRRRSPLRISFDHHYYLLAGRTVRDGSGAAVRRARGQVAIDETNASNALQWIFKLGEKGLSRDREAQSVRVAMTSTLTQTRPNMKRLLRGRACYWDARHREGPSCFGTVLELPPCRWRSK